jgi:predicted ArsR family transcriptional regulator
MSEDFAAEVVRVAALSEPVRRDLYRYVVAQAEPVSRDDAAVGTGVAHHVAKFNLDRLVADGLLEYEYSRPAGRSGPGAGRPAKRYRRAAREISVTLPQRRYDLAGQVLAEAITIAGRDQTSVAEALRAAATATGRRIAEDRDRDPSAPIRDVVSDILRRNGYEPRRVDGEVQLANCPFHSLAENYTELVCGMNVHLIDGILTAVGADRLCARLDPGPDRCCVTIDT